MHVRHVERLGQPLRGVAGIPVMAVEEPVLQALLLDETQRVLRPFAEVPVQVFLAEEVPAAAGHAEDAHMFVDVVKRRLVLEPARPDVDLESELGELLREFEHIDHLAAGVGRAQRRLGGDITVGRDHADAGPGESKDGCRRHRCVSLRYALPRRGSAEARACSCMD